MLQPLLGDDAVSLSSDDDDERSDYSGYSSDSSVSVKVKPTGMQMLKTVVVGLGLIVATASSGVAVIAYQSVAMFVAAGICVANIPYAAYKEYRIVKLPALRSLNNQLRDDANELEYEVDELTKAIDSLKPEADRAAAVEQELKEIADIQNCNVNKFVDLVKENKLIVNQMKDNLRHRIVQDIIQIVVMSDKNNDGRFCKVETKMLVLKIALQLQQYNVKLDERKFYKVMSGDPTVQQTISIVKGLIPALNQNEDDSNSDEEDEEHEAYDMFHMAGDEEQSLGISMSLASGGSGGTSHQESGGLNPLNLSLSIPKHQGRRKSQVVRASVVSAPVQEPAREKKSGSRRDQAQPKDQRKSKRRKRDIVRDALGNISGH